MVTTVFYLYKNNTTYGFTKQDFWGTSKSGSVCISDFVPAIAESFSLVGLPFQPQYEDVCLVLLYLVLFWLVVSSWRLLFSEKEIEGEWIWVGERGSEGELGEQRIGEM